MVLLIHKISHKLWRMRVPVLPRLLYGINRILFATVIPPSTKIGHGVLLGFSGLGVVIHARAIVGNNVKIGQHVTIGGRSGLFEVPIIEDGVEIGAGAKILGPIRLCRGCRIGVNAVVLLDVPAGATAVGVPARILRRGE